MPLLEELYNNLIQKSNNGYAFFSVVKEDNEYCTDLSYIKINNAYEELTGFKGTQVLGKTVRALLSELKIEGGEWIRCLIDTKMEDYPIDAEVYSKPTEKWLKVQAYLHGNEYVMLNLIDITTQKQLNEQYVEYKRAQDAFMVLAERYRVAVECSRDVIWDLDAVTGNIYISDRFFHTIGYEKEEFFKINGSIFEAIHSDDKEGLNQALTHHIEGKTESFLSEFRIKMKNNEYKWFIAKGRAVVDSYGRIERIAGSASDITERKNYEEQIRRLAYFDFLTGLPNRAFLIELLEARMNGCESNDCSGAIILVNIDNFKLINDTYGHFFGDKMLKIISERLCNIEINNKKVILTKLGGDEFLFIIDKPDNKTEIEEIAVVILNSFKQIVCLEDKSFYITCSMGVAQYPENGIKVYDIIKNADTAMNRAKANGKNCCAFYNQAMGTEIAEKLEMENYLRLALERNEFKLYYQPQVDIASAKIIGFEALIRWFSPKYGLVSPMAFIPLAEENGQIIEIGNWVIENVCKFAVKINKLHDKNLHVTLNVSAVQFMHEEFIDKLFDAVEKYGVNPHNLGIELTESTLLESSENIVARLNKLRNAGFKVYLDDFGTGYSSMTYLRKLPIDIIKIDKSFVGDIGNYEVEKKLLKSIVHLAQEIGLKVVAEGVETKEQLDFLASSKCDIIQGFLFSKPVSEEDVEKMLTELSKVDSI
ncbi:sensor domain-containing protein [Pseudobacteroides cellulosolvens]|uniref:Diguanylate cyclase/phosphodiesterase with PAS/PAC sensor(S) n=1 Tax=Pseudobacteroides cellulosolvens ATCC 35603 = DSM 2933 TaxID=398512 RepID=A0A0L6JVS7_9FIRM|nr:EAL domain-containing protein [Pseudobacteroides cellulosolvens]KNY29943.1 diguanylate cyclase/phosphodiesterase with PAS/PAC sensor(s) [Pseudobacteroides cellulosolvens ATCC 35603 = DSM 2933]